MFVDFTGDFVRQGQQMLTIYSPEMLASQQELLLAARARDLMRNNPRASAAQHGDSLFDAAKRRLQLWQLSDDQIQHVLTTGQPIASVTLYAPASGFVSERKAFPNQKVTPDSDLYTITDLSRTKNFSMIVAAVLAITLDPAMRLLFTHMENFSFRPQWLARVTSAVLVGKIHSEDTHPISRILIRVYEPICAWSLRWKWFVLAGAVATVALTVPTFNRLGSEFMPPLDEGTLLSMPSTLPGISVTEA